MGPEAPAPSKPLEEFVFLRHAPCVTLLGEWPAMPRRGAVPGSPRALVARSIVFLRPSLGGSGRCLLMAPILDGAEGRGEAKGQARAPIGRGAPKPRAEEAGVLGLGLSP
jgi:hypothetical protein